MSPLRLLDAWIDHRRLIRECGVVEYRLGRILERDVTLSPASNGGGQDRIFFAKTRRAPGFSVASVRMNCPWRTGELAEPSLPRIALSAVQRLTREARCYERLSEERLSPELIEIGPHYLANTYLHWRRLSHVLKQCSANLWPLLPVVLDAVRRMHHRGVTHMDLNCGNVLIAPNFREAAFIDFEYAPAHRLLRFDQQRFDFLRLAHDLLKPRRGREAAFRHPARFVSLFAQFVPESGFGLPEPFEVSGFSRVLEHPVICEGLADLLGIIPLQIHDSVSRSNLTTRQRRAA
jgi:tRNA A-37 threonylcarbamoyl transferase component Bud32